MLTREMVMASSEPIKTEVDEISHEDLEAAAEKFDDIKANPDKYFTARYKDAYKIIQALNKAAQSAMEKAEKINTQVSGNWTRRRQSFADAALHKQERIIKYANVLKTLAVMWENNDVPDLLINIRSFSDVEWLFQHNYPNPPDAETGDWYKAEYPALLKKAQKLGLKSREDSDRAHILLNSMGSIKLSPDQEKKKQLDEAIKQVRTYKIEGFFPTPDDVIDKMIQYARLTDEHTLLEPSAGIGNIPDRVRTKGINCKIGCVEIRPALAKILELKGYETACCDILTDPVIHSNELLYDRILMNPPFEHGQDVEHVRHCFDTFLATDGILVSVMSAGVLSNKHNKYIDFRNWVEDIGGFFENLGSAFKGSFNSTGTSVILLVLQK